MTRVSHNDPINYQHHYFFLPTHSLETIFLVNYSTYSNTVHRRSEVRTIPHANKGASGNKGNFLPPALEAAAHRQVQ